MQIMELSSWTAFKALVTSKALLIQYSEMPDNYDLFAPEAGAFLWHTTIPKDGGSDQTDFEANFKSTANAPLEVKAGTGRPERLSMSPQPMNTYNKWKGYQVVMDPGMTYSFVDISWPTQVYFRGGYCYTNSDDPDEYINTDVLLAATSQVYMPNMIQNVYLAKGILIPFISDESMAFPTSLKLRVHVHCPDGLSETETRYFNILSEYFQ